MGADSFVEYRSCAWMVVFGSSGTRVDCSDGSKEVGSDGMMGYGP